MFVADEKWGERAQPQGRFRVNEMRESPREERDERVSQVQLGSRVAMCAEDSAGEGAKQDAKERHARREPR